MRHLVNSIKVFYQKNRLLIIIGLGFMLVMQICSQGGRVETESGKPNQIMETSVQDTETKPLQEIYRDQIHQKRAVDPEVTSLFILIGLVLLFYVATKRGWLKHIVPAIVWVSLKVRRNNDTKERLATLTVSNHTKESITFTSPVIAFNHLFKKARRFRLKSGVGHNAFPITLLPGTSHQIVINIDVFRKKAGGLSAFRWVKFEIEGRRPKVHSSAWKYLF